MPALTDAATPFAEEILLAASALRRGEVVAYPTETYYGLGVNALDELALRRLRQLKGRGADKAISVLVDGDEMLTMLCAEVPPAARRLMERHWPGPLTIAMPARAGVPAALLMDGCVAVRRSPHPTAQALVTALGAPLTTTSANLPGGPPATCPEQVDEVFEGRCRILHGGTTPGGPPSTVVRVRGDDVDILRRGAIRLESEDPSP